MVSGGAVRPLAEGVVRGARVVEAVMARVPRAAVVAVAMALVEPGAELLPPLVVVIAVIVMVVMMVSPFPVVRHGAPPLRSAAGAQASGRSSRESARARARAL